MQEDIEILELVLKYYDKPNSYGNKLLEREKQALERVLNRLKEDESVIKIMIQELSVQFSSCEPCQIEYKSNCGQYNNCYDCVEQYFRKKVQNERSEV